mmetsp:Transcript_18662/g.29268  ORF Transcript_18662/g.29268 Transcript_18662/m.29268 type:complete len:113 (-) Transcript_18662:916-1254(-)
MFIHYLCLPHQKIDPMNKKIVSIKIAPFTSLASLRSKLLQPAFQQSELLSSRKWALLLRKSRNNRISHCISKLLFRLSLRFYRLVHNNFAYIARWLQRKQPIRGHDLCCAAD